MKTLMTMMLMMMMMVVVVVVLQAWSTHLQALLLLLRVVRLCSVPLQRHQLHVPNLRRLSVEHRLSRVRDP